MSVIHADGMALYGTGATSRTNMLAGVYAAINSSWSCETTNPRGDGTHALRGNTLSSGHHFRRVLGADKAAGLGFACANYFSQLPNVNTSHVLFQARDNANNAQWSLTLDSTGDLSVRTGAGNGTVVAQTSAPAIVAQAFQHLELFAVSANSGSVEVRVDGQTVLNATGIDTQGQSASGVEQYIVGNDANGTFAGVWDLCDLCVWDTSGSVNNDFLGDVQWLPFRPSGDESASDWTRNTGATDFDAIDDTAPDGDTTYVEATASSQVSEYTLPNVPANTSDIIAVITQPMARKTDAGAGSMQVGLLGSAGSPTAVHSGTNRPMTEVYTYYPDVHETDPSTGVRFTPSGFNAARLRLTRTA